LYDGTSTGLSTSPYWNWLESQAGAFFGWSVKGNLNLDGTGSPDLIVGAPYYDGTCQDEGRVYVFRNFTNPGAGWTATVDTLDTTAPQAGARLGCGAFGLPLKEGV